MDIKKIVVIISVFLFILTACSEKEKEIEVHANVDEQLAKDTIKVLDILKGHIRKSKKPEFQQEDEDLLTEYLTVYAPKKAYKQSPKLYEKVDPPFTTDDYQVYIRTETLLLSFGPEALVDEKGHYVNGTSNFDWQMEDILDVIQNGFEK